MQNATLLEITCHGSILVQRIMDYVQRLQFANLQLKLEVIWYNWTRHWTWEPVGPVTVLIFPQLFFLMAWLVQEIMILTNCRPRGVFWYCHTYVGSGYFFFGGGGSKFWILIYFGVFRKMNIFWVLRFCEYFFFFFFFGGGGGGVITILDYI